MRDKDLQKEILKFIAENEDCLKKNLNVLSAEFTRKGYGQEIINKNLYLLAKDGKIGANIVDNEAHRAYAPLILLEKGREEIKPWIKKNLLKLLSVIGIVASTIAAMFSILSFFK